MFGAVTAYVMSGNGYAAALDVAGSAARTPAVPEGRIDAAAASSEADVGATNWPAAFRRFATTRPYRAAVAVSDNDMTRRWPRNCKASSRS